MGCTDSNASNFNPNATNDNGSCEYIICDSNTEHQFKLSLYDTSGDGWINPNQQNQSNIYLTFDSTEYTIPYDSNNESNSLT